MNTKEGVSWSAGVEKEHFYLFFPEGMHVLGDNFHFSNVFILGKHSLFAYIYLVYIYIFSIHHTNE